MSSVATSEAYKPSGNPKYNKGQSWGALRKAWIGYKIAKRQGDKEKMKEYAEKIRTLQGELGLKKTDFPDLGIVGQQK